MPFLKPLTPDEYRKKHPRCGSCVYAGCRSIFDSDSIYCNVIGSYKDTSVLRLFCRMYKPRPFTE